MNQKWGGILAGLIIMGLVIGLMARDEFLGAGWVILLFFIVPAIGRPDLWWMATLATFGSGLSMGLPGDATLHLMTMLGFVVLIAVKVAISNMRALPVSRTRKACIALLCIIVLTASFRGWGLKILDSAYWGGMQYVSLIAALLFYIFSGHVTISWRQMNRTLIAFFLLALLPAIALLIVHYIPHGDLIRKVIMIGGDELNTLGSQLESPDVTRWGYMQYPAIWMGVLAIVIYDRKLKVSPVVIFISALSFLMLGLSGHRTVVVLLGVTMCVYVTIRRHSVRLSQYLRLLSILILMIAVIYLFVEYLPLAFQRAFAWLPGIHVSYLAGLDANSTSEWRIELWKQLVQMIPDYLWMGRGMAFSVSDYNAASVLASDRNTMYSVFVAVHLYHNGPLWFLIDLGLAGFIAGAGFMVGGIVHYGRKIKTITEGSWWKSLYIVFYSFFVGYCVFFFVVIGGGSFLCHILVVASMLEVIQRSAEAERLELLSNSGQGDQAP